MPRPKKKTVGPYFGPGVIGKEAFEQEKKVVRTGRHVFGPGVIDYPKDEAAAQPGREASTLPEVLQLDATECIKELAKITNHQRLEKLHHLELERPDIEGGRNRVLLAIEKRIFEEEGAEPNELIEMEGGLPEILEGTVGEVRERLAGVHSPDTIEFLEAKEAEHPEYEGGRRGVFRALKARKDELGQA